MCYFPFIPGVALDSVDGKDISVIKKQGKVKALEDEIFHRAYYDNLPGMTKKKIEKKKEL